MKLKLLILLMIVSSTLKAEMSSNYVDEFNMSDLSPAPEMKPTLMGLFQRHIEQKALVEKKLELQIMPHQSLIDKAINDLSIPSINKINLSNPPVEAKLKIRF